MWIVLCLKAPAANVDLRMDPLVQTGDYVVPDPFNAATLSYHKTPQDSYLVKFLDDYLVLSTYKPCTSRSDKVGGLYFRISLYRGLHA